MAWNHLQGILPLTLVAPRWCELVHSQDPTDTTQAVLLKLWAEYQFPLGWTRAPVKEDLTLYPSLGMVEAAATYNKDSITGLTFTYNAGWAPWQAVQAYMAKQEYIKYDNAAEQKWLDVLLD